MLRNKLVRSDGSVIDSSVILFCEYSEEVNSGGNLNVGDVTSSELSVEVLSTVQVEQDETLTYYIIEDDIESLIGQFKVERPTIASRTTIKFSAYDNVAKSEKLFSDWLILNQGLFPMTLLDLVQYACDYCGLSLAGTDFPHAELSINAFSGEGITCRQVLGWAAAIAGRFVRATPAGEIEFAWYTEVKSAVCYPSFYSFAPDITVTDDGEGNIGIECEEMTVTDDGEGNVVVDIPGVTMVYNNGNITFAADSTIAYFLDGVSYESYTTDAIAKVRINHSGSDVGISYPSDIEGNCFTMSGNAILNACAAGDVASVAASLYNQLSTVSYVPAKIRIPRTVKIRAGDIIRFYTPAPEGEAGQLLTTYVMRVTISASGTSVESTGDKSYGVTQAYTEAAAVSLSVETTSGLTEISASEFTPGDYTLLLMGVSATDSGLVCPVAIPAPQAEAGLEFQVADGSTWTLSPTGLAGDGSVRYIYGMK